MSTAVATTRQKRVDDFDPSRTEPDDARTVVEPSYGKLISNTLPYAERKAKALELLSGHCKPETIDSLIATSGTVAAHEDEINRTRISIGGHFSAILYSILSDLQEAVGATLGEDVLVNRAKELTYSYIEAVHGHQKATARNYMMVFELFHNNEQAIRILKFSEMIELGRQTSFSDDDRQNLIDTKEQALIDNGPVSVREFKGMIADYQSQLKNKDEELDALKSTSTQLSNDHFLESQENGRLRARTAELERTIAEQQARIKSIEQARFEASERMVAASTDAQRLDERIKSLTQELETARKQTPQPKVEYQDKEVLPPEYQSKQEAIAAAQAELTRTNASIESLRIQEASLKQKLADANQALTSESRIAELNGNLDDVLEKFSEFHAAYIATRMKISASGETPRFRDRLVEFEGVVENFLLEVKAAVARGA